MRLARAAPDSVCAHGHLVWMAGECGQAWARGAEEQLQWCGAKEEDSALGKGKSRIRKGLLHKMFRVCGQSWTYTRARARRAHTHTETTDKGGGGGERGFGGGSTMRMERG